MTGTVAVTGATGFIGWHVASRFRDRGWHVRALVRPESQRPVPEGVERITTSLEQPAILAACRGADLILHLAAVIKARSALEYSRSNVDATREVALAARQLGVRLVHVSSLGAIGPGSADNPPSEDTSPQPVNPYGATKLESERVVREIEGLDWTILRPTLVYGPRDRLFLPLFKFAQRGVYPVLHARAAYNLIHVDDVTRGLEVAATSGAGSRETFFLGHPTHVTQTEIMGALASVFGRTFRPLRVPRGALQLAASMGTLGTYFGLRPALDRARWRELDAGSFVCRIDKARDRLGFVAAIDQLDGFGATAEWYARNGWLRPAAVSAQRRR